MSDIVLVAIITGVFSLLTITLTHIINVVTRRSINSKVEKYHEEVNGKMALLLETTKKLGEETGKQKEKDNPS